MSVFCECRVLSGKHLWDRPIPRLEESYRVWCVLLNVFRCNDNPQHLQWVGRRGQTKKKGNKDIRYWSIHIYAFVGMAPCRLVGGRCTSTLKLRQCVLATLKTKRCRIRGSQVSFNFKVCYWNWYSWRGMSEFLLVLVVYSKHCKGVFCFSYV